MGRQGGPTRWGHAWLEALEAGALANDGQLSRGRSLARRRLVRHLQLEPGRLAATVTGAGGHTPSLAVPTLTDEAWAEVTARVMGSAQLVATLLAGEVPHQLDDLLLPAPGELVADCTCSDDATLCRHAAALCHRAAEVFDADPFALLLVRGRARAHLLADLRRRRAEELGIEHQGPGSNRPRGLDPGVAAADAYRRWRATSTAGPAPGEAGDAPAGSTAPGEHPTPDEDPAAGEEPADTPVPTVPVPARARTLVRLAAPPPADAGIDESELRDLVADGARRAVAMLAGEGGSGLGLSVGADVARRAIAGDVDAIAATTGLPPDELAAAARAFHHGGAEGLAASRHRWAAPTQELAPGVAALTAHPASPTPDGTAPTAPKKAAPVVTRANTVSAGSVQLRLDQHGTWWRFEADDELGWLLAAPGSTDPTDLV
jgi:uncharacterized Zn finger protein